MRRESHPCYSFSWDLESHELCRQVLIHSCDGHNLDEVRFIISSKWCIATGFEPIYGDY